MGTTEPRGDPSGHWLRLMPRVIPSIAAPRPCHGGGKKIIAEECLVLLTFALQIFRIPQRTVTGLVRLQRDAICLLSQLSPVIHLRLAEPGMGKTRSRHPAPWGEYRQHGTLPSPVCPLFLGPCPFSQAHGHQGWRGASTGGQFPVPGRDHSLLPGLHPSPSQR